METIQKQNPGKAVLFVKQNTLLLAFLIAVVILAITAKGFLTPNNIINIVRVNSIFGLLAMGVTLVILSGNIDLSTAGTTALCGCVAGILSRWSIPLAVGAALVIGLIVGLANGLLLIKFKLQSFILTLGVASVLAGLTLIITQGSTVYGIPKDYTRIVTDKALGLPYPIWIFMIVVVIFAIFLAKTKFGRYIYACGSNEEAARLSGINTRKLKVVLYIICGFCSALAGVLLTARVNAAEPLAANGWNLQAVTAVIIGGTALRGGRGGVLHTLLGVFLLGVIDNGMILLGISSFYQQFVKGVIIVIAILIDSIKK